MLLIETTVDRITEILESQRPIALVPAESRNRAKEIAVAAENNGFGVAVLLDRSERLFVLVVGDMDQQARLNLQRFVRRFGVVSMDRHIDIEKVFCWPGWLATMALHRTVLNRWNEMTEAERLTFCDVQGILRSGLPWDKLPPTMQLLLKQHTVKTTKGLWEI